MRIKHPRPEHTCRTKLIWMLVMIVHEEQAAAGTSSASATDPLLRVLDALKWSEQRMEGRLNLLEEEVHRSQDEAFQKAAKKAKHEKTYSLRKKGHQEQHDFNERVAAKPSRPPKKV